MTTLRAEALTRESFAPFGAVISDPDRPHDATGPGWSWWAETHTFGSDGRRWALGRLRLEPTELLFDWAECHMRSPEVIFATSADLLVYVGPATGGPDRLPPQEDFRAFRVAAGEGVELRPGVWHGAPFSPETETAAWVLLLEGTGRDDVSVIRFADSPVTIEVPMERERDV